MKDRTNRLITEEVKVLFQRRYGREFKEWDYTNLSRQERDDLVTEASRNVMKRRGRNGKS